MAVHANEGGRPPGSRDAPFTTEIVVPAELVARSRPSGHSVPITRMKEQLQRPDPYSNMSVAALLTMVLLLAVSIGFYAIDAVRAAGYRLPYWLAGAGVLMALAALVRFAFRQGLQVKAGSGADLAEGGGIDSSGSSHDGGH